MKVLSFLPKYFINRNGEDVAQVGKELFFFGRNKRSEVITPINMKGGVGKTTLAVNVAYTP